MLAITFSPIVGILVSLRIHGHVWEIDEGIFSNYMCPGAAAGLFLSIVLVLFFRKKLSLITLSALLLGAAAGTGLAVLLAEPILDRFEPPGSDLVFMVLYPIFFCISGMGVGFLISRKISRYLKG